MLLPPLENKAIPIVAVWGVLEAIKASDDRIDNLEQAAFAGLGIVAALLTPPVIRLTGVALSYLFSKDDDDYVDS